MRLLKKVTLSLSVLIPTLGLAFFGGHDLHGATVDSTEWSVDFRDVSLPEALRELARVTGVEIHVKQPPPGKVFSKSYNNHTISQIIKDMFKGISHAAIYNYGQGGLSSIEVRVFEASGAGPVYPASTGSPQQEFHSAMTRRFYRPTRPRRRLQQPRSPAQVDASESLGQKRLPEQPVEEDAEEEAVAEVRDREPEAASPEVDQGDEGAESGEKPNSEGGSSRDEQGQTQGGQPTTQVADEGGSQ